jgi:hypothetical protein
MKTNKFRLIVSMLVIAILSIISLSITTEGQEYKKRVAPGIVPSYKDIEKPPICAKLSFKSTSPLPSTSIYADYEYQIETTGGYPPVNIYTESPSSASSNREQAYDTGPNYFPVGLTMSNSGLITGQAFYAHNYNFTVVAKDSCPSGPQIIKKTFALNVNPKPQ